MEVCNIFFAHLNILAVLLWDFSALFAIFISYFALFFINSLALSLSFLLAYLLILLCLLPSSVLSRGPGFGWMD